MSFERLTQEALAVKVRIQDRLAELGIRKHCYWIKRVPGGLNVHILKGKLQQNYHIKVGLGGAVLLRDLQHMEQHLKALGLAQEGGQHDEIREAAE